VINGKAWTSRALHADLLLLLVRTAPHDPQSAGRGAVVFLVDLRNAPGITIRPTAAIATTRLLQVKSE
jgi:acyl-CoA dehydrogenase